MIWYFKNEVSLFFRYIEPLTIKFIPTLSVVQGLFQIERPAVVPEMKALWRIAVY